MGLRSVHFGAGAFRGRATARLRGGILDDVSEAADDRERSLVGGLTRVAGQVYGIAGQAYGLAEQVPLVGGVFRGAREQATAALADTADLTAELLRRVGAVVLREVVELLTEEIDLTGLVVDHVDLERVVAELDLDRLIEGIDVEALIGDLDLNPLVADLDLNPVVHRLDLNPVVHRLDLNPAVEDIDLNPVLARLDLNPAVAGLDLDEVVSRLDLIKLVEDLLDDIDLTDIIRDAGESVTTEMLTDVRSTGERADDAVEQFFDRLLRRRRNRDDGAEKPAAVEASRDEADGD